MRLKYILVSILFINCVVAFGQGKKDTSFYSGLTKDNEVVVGVYTGENLTTVKPYQGGYFIGINNNGISYVGRGFDDDFFAKLKTPEGILLCCGLSYYMQRYSISGIRGTDSSVYLYSGSTPSSPIFNNDHYTTSFRNYSIGVPLSIGYSCTKRRYTYYFSLGIEFYYNYKTELSYRDSTTGKTIFQQTYTKGRMGQYWSGSYLPLADSYWSQVGAFGTLNLGMSYYFTPKFSVAFEPMLRFTNPLAPNAVVESPSGNRGQATLSLNIGVNYTFKIENSGRLLPFNEEKKPDKFSVGFAIVPNYFGEPSGYTVLNSKPFSFSYAFTFQYRFAPRFALESGIALDNYSIDNIQDNVYMGISLVFRYDFYINKKGNNMLYAGLGTHIDYYTNFQNDVYFYTGHYITPIGLAKVGYEAKLGGNYFLDLALGYEHFIHTFFLKGSYNGPQPFDQLPHVFFGSVGLSYRFK